MFPFKLLLQSTAEYTLKLQCSVLYSFLSWRSMLWKANGINSILQIRTLNTLRWSYLTEFKLLVRRKIQEELSTVSVFFFYLSVNYLVDQSASVRGIYSSEILSSTRYMVSMTKIWSVSNEIVTMQKTMTHVLGQHYITWLGGSRLQNRIQTMIFHYKNPSFSPIWISDSLHDHRFLPFFFHCVYLLNNIAAISALAAWNSPITLLRKLFPHPRLSLKDPTEHCQTGTVRNIVPALAEGQPLWRAAEQVFYCCLQFNTHL